MEDATGLDERETPVDPECQPADQDKLRGPEDDDPDPDEPWPTAGPASRGSSSFSSGRDRAQPTVTQRGNSRGACAKEQAGERRTHVNIPPSFCHAHVGAFASEHDWGRMRKRSSSPNGRHGCLPSGRQGLIVTVCTLSMVAQRDPLLVLVFLGPRVSPSRLWPSSARAR